MDIGLAVEHLLPSADFGSANDYAALTRTWRDARPLPSLQALEAAWQEVLTLQEAAATEQTQADVDKGALSKANLVAILSQIQDRKTEIAADLALLPTATATQQRQIVGRLLTAQDGILSLLILIGKALSRLV